jgi:DNA-binding transcriptional MocR family regulator
MKIRRYQEVVRYVQECIDSGSLRPGEKVQSIREMAAQTGFSVVTVQHAYALLESEGVIEARPRSGYYVAETGRADPGFPDEMLVGAEKGEASIPAQLYKLIALWRDRQVESFGSLHPSSDLLRTQELLTHMRRYLRQVRADRPPVSSLAGDPDLRDIIARRAALRGVRLRENNVVVTTSSQVALDLCLDTVTQPGDLVMIESPTYFPLIAALERRHLKAIEIYSHPTNGVDPDQFDYLIDNNDIRACLLMPVNHFPTGVTYATGVLARLAAKITARGVPVVEYDAFAELTHSSVSPPSLKSYDRDDLILQVGSFAATLGPLAGSAWILNGRYRERILERLSFTDLGAGEAALQHAIAECILRRSYDRQLRNVREQLKRRMRRGLLQIGALFPAQCAVSHPSGGFMCWVRLPGEVDSLKVAMRAAERDLSVLPGPLFSVANSFRNFIGLNFSCNWTAATESGLKALAEAIEAERGA